MTQSTEALQEREAIKWAASIADKMAGAASKGLEMGHDNELAAQFDTATEIAAAIRGQRPSITGPVPAFASLRVQPADAGTRSKAYRDCAQINRNMVGVIGALPGSSIYAALEACAEKMDEIALAALERGDG